MTLKYNTMMRTRDRIVCQLGPKHAACVQSPCGLTHRLGFCWHEDGRQVSEGLVEVEPHAWCTAATHITGCLPSSIVSRYRENGGSERGREGQRTTWSEEKHAWLGFREQARHEHGQGLSPIQSECLHQCSWHCACTCPTRCVQRSAMFKASWPLRKMRRA